ncbi:MAG TPA: aspartate/glutamate racemase family protein [Ramlibacter sp.]|nr:aspartate/glutamate racemase family protein [Ramlibacter sp.]
MSSDPTPSPASRIALIHATALAIDPIKAAFERHWRQAQRMNLLDDSLSVDRARDGRLTEAMVQRFIDLAIYARDTGCRGILFTCSAFGPAIEAAGRASGVPTLKPNEAMFQEALALAVQGKPARLGLIATFQASIPSMSEELQAMAKQRGVSIDLRTVFVPEAMDDLAQSRAEDHHRKIAQAARQLSDCDAVMLAQFSMAAALLSVQRELKCPVLSSPDCAVLALKQGMTHA